MATAKKTSSRTPAQKSPTEGSDDGEAAKKTSKKATTPRKRSAASAPRAEAPKRKGAPQIAGEAARQLLELTGKEPEGISGLSRTDDGWVVQVEVLELRRIPNTTDVLASYDVEVDSDGELQGYRRVHRYVRGVPEGGS